MTSHVYDLRTAGYTVISDALGVRAPALRETVDRLLREDDSEWGHDRLLAMGQRGALRNLCDLDPAFGDLLVDSPVYPVIDEVLGGDYILHSYDSLTLFAAESRFPWDFHTDLSALSGVAFPASRTPCVNCLYSLTDTTAENGATWVVPGSQRSLLSRPSTGTLVRHAVQICTKAGDAILFDGRIWHCAGNNTSSEMRTVIKAFFVLPWQRPQMDYSRAVRPERLAALDPRVRRMLCVGQAPAASIAELRGRLASRGAL